MTDLTPAEQAAAETITDPMIPGLTIEQGTTLTRALVLSADMPSWALPVFDW